MATLIQKTGLLRGLLTGERAYSGPIYVDIDLSNRCNMSFVGCPYHHYAVGDRPYASGEEPFVSSEMAADLCLSLKSMGARQLILQGAGEPLLPPPVHPHRCRPVRSPAFRMSP